MKKHWFVLMLVFVVSTVNAAIGDHQNSSSFVADGEVGGYEYVNLGLPSGTLWATCNVGASSPYESGSYFAWGETETKDIYTWENYKFFKDYDFDPAIGTYAVLEYIGENICGTQYDAAAKQWGNGWRLPNDEETYELRMYCWGKWTTEEGVKGMRIYGPNEHSIFIPACGWKYKNLEMTWDYGFYGDCMSGIEDADNRYSPSNTCKAIEVGNSMISRVTGVKAVGRNVRAVINPRDVTGGLSVGSMNETKISFHNNKFIITGNVSSTRLTLYSLAGKVVFECDITANTIPLPILEHGIYILKLSSPYFGSKIQKINIK